MSALTRMAFSDHKKVEIGKGDLVIISASPIPGNEKTVSNVINELYRKGAEVVHSRLTEVHVSGHACREEPELQRMGTRRRHRFSCIPDIRSRSLLYGIDHDAIRTDGCGTLYCVAGTSDFLHYAHGRGRRRNP